MDARKLNSPAAQETIRAADEAIMSRDALAGEIEQTVEDEKNAPSPGEALEAIERRRQLSAEYVVARQQAEEVLTQLREAVRNDSPERQQERMEEGRARNRENGQYDEKYDSISTQELSAERERLNLRLEQVETELEGAYGSRYRRFEKEAERLYNERSAVEAEILLRGEVYGARPDGIGESAQAGGMPMAVVADDFGNEDVSAIVGGDVQSVDNAGVSNGYENSAIAQDAALRDYAPENSGAADAGQYGQVRTLGEAANALYQAVSDNALQTGHEYNVQDYDELIKKVQADGGTHTGAEWEKILKFSGNNPLVSNLERFVHNTQERTRNRSNGLNVQSSQEVVSASELFDFVRNEMASDAANMRLRKAQYDRIFSHEDVPVHVLEETTLTTRDKYSDARNKAQFGDAVNVDTGVTVTLNKEGYSKTVNGIRNMIADLRPAALAALANYKTLITDGVYVGSYPDYGESANIKEMHCFVAAFEYGGEQYRAMYTAKESRNSDGSYSAKLYLQRVEALKAQKEQQRLKTSTTSGPQGINYNSTSAANAVDIEDPDGHFGPTGTYYINSTADNSIVDTNGNVNTISTNELLEGYNLNDKKMWPLSQVDSEMNGGDVDSVADQSASQSAYENVNETNIAQKPQKSGTLSTTQIPQGGGIYVNGKPLFSAMTDAELDSEIAREGRNAGSRLDELRSERENRTGQENADRRKREGRLGEIEQMLSDAPKADDSELNMQERYLRRRAAQLDSEIEVAKDSGDDVKGLTDELRRTQDNMNAIHEEQQRRAQVRQEAGESLINEIREQNPGAARADAQEERERIRQSQQAGRKALDALKAEREGQRAWRTTDTISIEEAARVFTDGADIESTLKANQEAISQWEQRREQLGGAEADLQEELSSLREQQARMMQEDAGEMSADDVRERLNVNERIIRIQNDMDQVKGLRQQIDSSLRYLNAHAGDGVIETLKSGRIPEQMMERIMGYVDEIRVPKSGAIGMNMNTPARVIDDLFGDASPVMRAIYTDPIAEHEADRQRYIAGAREKIDALKLNKAERELVQRVGEGIMTPADLDKAIDESLIKRGSKLKSGDGTWQEEAEVNAPRVSTAEQAREALGRAIDNNPLQAGHEYKAGDYDELIKKVQADGGTHTADEWDRILGFVGNNPRASNLERFVHNTQERTRNRSNGVNSQSSQEVVSANELLEFMRDEMASDAANMRLRQAQYERILSHENVPVHVLEETTLTTRDKYTDAKGKAQFGDAVNSDTGVTVTLNKDGYRKTIFSIGKMDAELQPAALAALANYKALIADGVYVGSYPDYGESAYIKQMHCFVSAFEYDGEQYRAMYTAKETRNDDGSYSTKLYLQRVEALKAQKEQRSQTTSTASSPQGTNYVRSAVDSSIAPETGAVNTIDAKTLLEVYNLSALKAWPLSEIDVEERSAGDAGSGWGRKADEVRRINHAVTVFNGIYEELYNMVNDAYVRNGYEKMGKRKNYFPHFQEEESNLFENFARKLGFGAGKYALPTSIDGLTETFSPGRNYNKHAEHRLGTDTAFDAIAGFEDYIESATKAAYLTDDIKRLRQLEREIRAGEQIGTLNSRTKLSKANGDFGSLAKWVHEYANLVAGKKSSLDRGVESYVGRRAYQVLDTSSQAISWAYDLQLQSNGLPAMVVNASHMKAVPGRKTDVKDAEWIADLLQHGLLKSSFIPDKAQRELAELDDEIDNNMRSDYQSCIELVSK